MFRKQLAIAGHKIGQIACSVLSILVASACAELMPAAPSADTVLDGSVDALSGPQLAVHAEGDAQFSRAFGPLEGLGPVFVSNSCISCHAGEGKGHPVFNITRFGRSTPSGFDPLRSLGGPQLQNRAVLDYIAESIPNGITGIARFTAPSVTGLGLLEGVDDSTLLRLQDPDDRDGDGISGRVQLLTPDDLLARVASLDAVARDGPPTRGTLVDGKYIGRFGKKGVAINLLHQVVTAYHEDMGVTSDLISDEIFNPAVGNFTGDRTPEPEVSSSVVNAVTFYLKTLKAPPRRNATSPDVMAGETLFTASGCAGCHTTTLRSGTATISALDRVEFHPYTDLLLHDMGSALDDGYTEGRATTAEWRTAPLWGLGLAAAFQGGTPRLMHDGRATSITDAIRLHGGEATASRTSFERLSSDKVRQLLAFLESL
jgi:CxxC motif-containing protein (DUF1111 family)